MLYTAREGERLDLIAYKLYGDAKKIDLLLRKNQITKPFTGEVLEAPEEVETFLNSHGKVILFIPSEVQLKNTSPKKGKIIGEIELYTGSESRFIVFLQDIKSHQRFKRFEIIEF